MERAGAKGIQHGYFRIPIRGPSTESSNELTLDSPYSRDTSAHPTCLYPEVTN